MTVKQAAAILKQPRRTVQEWVTRGKIPATKLPGRTGAYLLDREAVEQMTKTPA